jgi:hypothetical protein
MVRFDASFHRTVRAGPGERAHGIPAAANRSMIFLFTSFPLGAQRPGHVGGDATAQFGNPCALCGHPMLHVILRNRFLDAGASPPRPVL